MKNFKYCFFNRKTGTRIELMTHEVVIIVGIKKDT